MFRSSLLFFIVLAIFPAQEATNKPGAVEGVVTNSLTGAPIRKAKVSLTKAGPSDRFSLAALSDPQGHFAFSNVEPGTYMVQASAQGFTSQSPGGRLRPVQPVKVAAEQRVKDVSVKLSPTAVITGKVLDENREPVSNVRVEALQFSYSERGAQQLAQRRSAGTDDRGEYRIFDLPGDRYYLRASGGPRAWSGGGRLHSTVPEEAFAPSYHPGVSDAAQATPVEVAPGAELLVDFRLHKIRVYHIRGKVSGTRTQGPVRAQIRVEACERGTMPFSMPSFTMVQPDGTFDASGVAPGTWCVTLEDRREDELRFARQTVTVSDRDLEGLHLQAGAAVEIRGTAIVEGGSADGLKNIRLMLTAVDTGYGGNSAAVKEDGTFAFRDVTPQTWQLTAMMMPKLYLKSIRFGDQEAPDGSFQVTPAGGALTLIFASDMGEVSGTVQSPSGEPAKNALVILAPVEDRYARRRDLVRMSFCQEGKFRTDSVPPGEYKVFAAEPSMYDLERSAELRKLLASRAASVSVQGGGRATVQVGMITAEEIEDARRKLR